MLSTKLTNAFPGRVAHIFGFLSRKHTSVLHLKPFTCDVICLVDHDGSLLCRRGLYDLLLCAMNWCRCVRWCLLATLSPVSHLILLL